MKIHFISHSFYRGTHLNSITSQVISNLRLADSRRILSHFIIKTSEVHLSRGRKQAWYWPDRLPWQRDPFAVHSVHHSRLAQCKISVSRGRAVGIFVLTESTIIRLMETNTWFFLFHCFLQLNIFASTLIVSLLFPDSCTINKGGCSHACTSIRHWKVQCSCPADMQLMGDGKTCQSGELLTAVKHKNSTPLSVFMTSELCNSLKQKCVRRTMENQITNW